MAVQSFIALAQNIALLLAVALLFDLFSSSQKVGQVKLEQFVSGILIGAVGLVIMSTPWTLMPGVVFDTRSVLLGISGLFFGTLPTVIAAGMTSLFRLYQGGAGAWTGVSVILASGGIGLLWRHLRCGKLADLSWRELFLFGLAVHITMLTLMLTLPWKIAWTVLSNISLPVILIYPAGTTLIGSLMVNRLQRDRRETATRESEEKYRALFSAMMDPVLVADIESGILVECNPAAERFFGQSREELLGKVQGELHDSRLIDDNGLLPQFKELCNSPGFIEDVPIIAAGGETRLVSVQASHFTMDGRRLILGDFRDTTMRKEAEEALMESENLYRSLFMDSQVVMLLVDPDTSYIVEANKSAEKYYGWGREQLEQKKISEINELSSEEIKVEMDAARRGKKRHFNFQHRLSNGEVRDVEVYSGPVSIKGKQMLYSCVFDVTEKRIIENKLRQSEEFQRAMIECSPVALYSVDLQGRVQLWNTSAERVFGWKAEEVLGSPLPIIDHAKENEFSDLRERVQKGETLLWKELVRKRKGGELIDISLSTARVLDPMGNIIGIMGAAQDITLRKREQEELLKAKEKAEAANQAKSEFLANMSHEIRTPLNGVLGMLQVLQTTSINDEQEEYILTAIQSSKRLTRLLSDILDLSRVEANRFSIQSQPLDLASVVFQTCELFMSTAQQTQIELHCHVDPRIPRTLNGDAARIQQVLTNLIGNSFKFTKKGHITVEAYSLATSERNICRILFCITDTGIGIPAEKIEQLFQPFSQVSTGYRRDYQGAGLGLSICKRLVELMGGNIALESDPDEGTTVHFCVSFTVDEPMSGQIVFSPTSAKSKGLRILLAEDEDVNRIATTKNLSVNNANFSQCDDCSGQMS